jgi:TPR repeat protein
MPPFHNDPLALAAVGHCHVAGRGVAADKSKAETFYREVGRSEERRLEYTAILCIFLCL